MEATWYALLALMLTVYVVLDGFDFGAGIAHLIVARSDDERRTVLAAIGPVWDGNEVWLVGSGGVLFFAFPRAYSAAFSGFYLSLMIVLWLLVVRGLSIEFRGQLKNPLWRAFFDSAFAGSSTVLAIVLGASLGNVIRGVPIGADQSFAAPLFTDFGVHGETGALDWYTVLVGLFAAAALAMHGAAYLVWKTEGAVYDRSRVLFVRAWAATALLLLGVTVATAVVQPALFSSFARRAWAWPAAVMLVGGFAASLWAWRRGRDRALFFGSAAFLAGLLLATAASLFPVLLRSTVDARWDVTAYGAATGRRGLMLGLTWWIPALLLAVGYFAYLFRSFAGKVRELHY
ncbi:MAG: Cytochrome d ubiquinol oxidase subunit [Myxococcales bacterium]|nr:Cytochrome d ubiquinol oxidase subunit [Myxococcales bacterium]